MGTYVDVRSPFFAKKGSSVVTIAATSLFFTGLDNVALTPQTLTPSGGTAPYSFVAVGFPAGVIIGAASGIISGTPTSAANTSASVTVTDSAAHTASIPVFFAISEGTFADTFHRADQPFAVGDQWAITPLTNSTCLGPNISAGISVGGNQLNFGILSSNGANEIMCWPIPITWNQVFSRPQYAQARITADNSGGANFAFNGPAAMMNVNLGTGYQIFTNIIFGVGNSVGKYTVGSWNGGAAVTTINNNANAGFSFALTDVLRIEVYPNTPGANQTTIKTFKNGVQQSSDVDNTNHYSFGVFGIMDYFVSAGITQSWDNFQGGAIS